MPKLKLKPVMPYRTQTCQSSQFGWGGGGGAVSDLQQPGLRAACLSPSRRAQIPAQIPDRSSQIPFQPWHQHWQVQARTTHRPAAGLVSQPGLRLSPSWVTTAMYFPLRNASEIKMLPFFCLREGKEKKLTEMKKYK